jgi:nitrite reductase/ring-hydroxylating ferredoxin subunit
MNNLENQFVRVAEREFVRVGSVSGVPPGTSKAFPLGRFDVAVFNIDGVFYALENTCPHQGGPLADGWIEGATVTCPWHAWCFDVRDGKMTLGDFARVTRFPVHIENDGIYVGVEPLPEEP